MSTPNPLSGLNPSTGFVPTPAAPQAVAPQQPGLFDLIRAGDPIAMQALVRLGAGLMQPIQPGDTSSGVAGRAFADSLDFFNQRRDAAGRAAREERELGIRQEGVDIQGQRADTEEEALAQRRETEQSRLKEEQRQFDEQKELREAQTQLAAAKARLQDRLPAKTGAGNAKNAQMDRISEALMMAEARAIKNGTLNIEDAVYVHNPDMAVLDAAKIVEGQDPGQELLQNVIPALIEAMPYMRGEDTESAQSALTDAIEKSREFDPIGRIPRGGPEEESDLASVEETAEGTPTGRTATDAEGRRAEEVQMPDGTLKWRLVAQ